MAAEDLSIDELRAKLTEKLGELHRRASRTTELLSPSTYWRDPWVRFGIGVAIGLVIAGPRRAQAADGGGESMLGSIVRAGLMAATSALVTRALKPGE